MYKFYYKGGNIMNVIGFPYDLIFHTDVEEERKVTYAFKSAYVETEDNSLLKKFEKAIVGVDPDSDPMIFEKNHWCSEQMLLFRTNKDCLKKAIENMGYKVM